MKCSLLIDNQEPIQNNTPKTIQKPDHNNFQDFGNLPPRHIFEQREKEEHLLFSAEDQDRQAYIAKHVFVTTVQAHLLYPYVVSEVCGPCTGGQAEAHARCFSPRSLPGDSTLLPQQRHVDTVSDRDHDEIK